MGIKSGYESFYINDSTDQYFIKPLDFIGAVTLEADFTFRKVQNAFSDVVMNFTIVSDVPQKPGQLLLQTEAVSASVNSIKSIYSEKKKDDFVYRYTSLINYSVLRDFFLSENPLISYNEQVLFPSNKSARAISSLRSGLFEFTFSEPDPEGVSME